MFMNRKIPLGAALALLLVVAALVFAITRNNTIESFNTRISDLRNREVLQDKYAEIDRLVRLHYNGSIEDDRLMDSIAQGYLAGIGDEYGRYLSAEEYKKLVQGSSGDNVGIGAVIEPAPDDFYLQVLEVYPDSPAEVAGIQAGDLIVKIDDTDLSRENIRQMLESIQGPAGSNITIVTRRGSTESAPLLMTRRAVAVPTVHNAHLLEDSTVAYLHISEFADKTYDQFNRELLKLMDAGATSLIIDLRDNKSDTLRSATRILDKLLGEGVLVTAVYKDGEAGEPVTSDANEINLPVVVLTNGGTTGVSEVFAQAIKDFDKGRTVGTTTAGKGTMQSIIKLSDGSAIELSVATYLTRSGQDFNKVGVKADFDVPMELDWTQLTEIENQDSQLMKAREVAVGLQKTTNGEQEGNAESTPSQPGGEDAAPGSEAGESTSDE